MPDCRNVASMSEIVQHEITSFIVPPTSPVALRERVLCLHEHSDGENRMGEVAWTDILNRFTWPLVVRRCLHPFGKA